ncbi:fructosyl amino acid oxidase [Pleomassaria siparia CBS 279.74]|uniref:Fructosyl amino acid oxidase n=1 Tax=Pleomassaria siparia CBS 279.74 TaxID=1314801 RepID=A0A6G1JT19_9PLEO|nr:fructosyl amino acid oxidase [Pleomassaria siparia CBS 279.74]
MASSNPKTVLVVGGGTFGTSTAYHLSLKPQTYSHITVLDRFPVPSKEAAGNDINKVIRNDYADPLYARLTTEAMALWADPQGLYKGLYHRSGWLLGAAESSKEFVDQSAVTARKLGLVVAEPVTADEIHKRWPVFTGEMDGWSTVWNPSAGWANARGALTQLALAAQRSGVQYIDGPQGHVVQLLYNESGRCVGAKAADGSAYFADIVVLAAGAAAAALLDFKGQLVAKGHTVGHMHCSPAELEKYGNMPIIAHLEGGLLFPPQEDGILKFGAMAFVTNFEGKDLSLPRYRSDNKEDGVPKPIETQMRNWLRECMPELADRDWFETRLCWDADTPDLHFLIDKHPSYPGLHLAVGGSAHGFKMMPVIGKYVVDSLEDVLEAEAKDKWRWRPGAKLQHANPHPSPLLELSEIPGFQRSSRKL